ncbi:hypothetical protein NMY22_g13493 [Coprinellus aureogranulatus]|nr:hypothetical protein NMY22_g13493 [Coprinellus aureogranulatus]
MIPHLAIEIYQEILEHFVDDGSLGDDFDAKVTPSGECLPPYPALRRELATVCTLVSKMFYDIATPITWQYLTVRTEANLDLLLKTIEEGSARSTRSPIGEYTRRIDFRGVGARVPLPSGASLAPSVEQALYFVDPDDVPQPASPSVPRSSRSAEPGRGSTAFKGLRKSQGTTDRPSDRAIPSIRLHSGLHRV